jgi:hypothetical protein
LRLKSAIWVAAYIRRCHLEGAFAVVRRRGAEEAGAIFVKISRLDGTAALYGPAPQSAFDEARPIERRFVSSLTGGFVEDAKAEAQLARQREFDPDLWVIEVEDRATTTSGPCGGLTNRSIPIESRASGIKLTNLPAFAGRGRRRQRFGSADVL